ncbi:MAG: hypothetical protein M1533_03915 [Candidatus Thermoplasmatota archaeon]|jgi:vacuolar-type H+-ATPase subunit E/Vma4|nr:hypothetical protein [Candidatus Thermoplasmatota archaeon]MCL5793296.1 hypothetical protein [Candidatus Thermoplasmatota archaeon]
MSLESIISEIDEKKKAQINSIQKEIDELVESRSQQLKKETDSLAEAFSSRKVAYANSVERSRRDLAVLEAARILTDARSKLIDDATSLVSEYLSNLRKRSVHRKILEMSIRLVEFQFPEGATVFAPEQDIEALKKFTADTRIKFEKGDMPYGILAASSDGKRELDLTFTQIWKAARDNIALALEAGIGE